jgi:putative FmdB family regulatory protein
MPIYGYACKSCEHTFDALQKMSDARLVDCPECGEPSLRKLLSAPKFRLKGQGWYETDFKTGDKRNIAGDSEKTSTADTKKTDTKKTDTKKTDTKKSEKKTESKKSPDKKANSA